MNNDLEQFSEERLIEISELTGAYEEWSASQDEIHALARIALAAKQTKPLAYADKQAFKNFSQGVASKEWMWAKNDAGLQPLYTTPQPAHTEHDGWIKCRERMPEIGSRVLITTYGKYVNSASYTKWNGAKTERGRAARFEDLRGIVHSVTHWMPLPAPPKPERE